MQHMMRGWTPELLGDPTMPMNDAWLDTGRKPWRYHFHAAITMEQPVIVDFDAKQQRMFILKASDHSVIVSAPMIVDMTPIAGVSLGVVHVPAITALNMAVHIDQVSSDPARAAGMQVGDTDKVRIVYDANTVDPKTHRVALLNFQHFINGKYLPGSPNRVMMPVTDGWLDLGSQPYTVHFKAAVVHGVPIVIDADENTHRLSIRGQGGNAVYLSGAYEIDPAPITGPEADAAGTPVPAGMPASAPPGPPSPAH
jgi:hypothetical protein